eukprot:CAMPEP_0185816060 /NCGR_PEP_ID=MMETSP1322-20130828/16813_1 /TAXON_ID=265543 /ORGANISM="Minutocellus polymorphus, Strain RCC2270" /LENGTH=61 /DNA_ID=CAMNT_0028512983 /DNA_START=128 /DNA_END=313 /DNA_ORIENTATION=+
MARDRSGSGAEFMVAREFSELHDETDTATNTAADRVARAVRAGIELVSIRVEVEETRVRKE